MCSVCGDRAHAVHPPTEEQFIETFYEVMDELNPDSEPLAFSGKYEQEFRELLMFIFRRASTQRV